MPRQTGIRGELTGIVHGQTGISTPQTGLLRLVEQIPTKYSPIRLGRTTKASHFEKTSQSWYPLGYFDFFPIRETGITPCQTGIRGALTGIVHGQTGICPPQTGLLSLAGLISPKYPLRLLEKTKEAGIILFLSKGRVLKSIGIQALEALHRRMPELHPKKKYVEEDVRKSVAGFKGEMEVNRHLVRLHNPEYRVFHGLWLSEMYGEYFQMDFLLISPSFFLIIEVKNYAGEIILERDYPQLIQIKNGVTTAYKDPIIQVIRQKNLLVEWLHHNEFPDIPVEYLVVIANQHAIIKASPQHFSIFDVLINSDYLSLKIEKLQQKYRIKTFNQNQLLKLSNLLLTSDSPLHTNILQKYLINENDLLNGVHCPLCFALPMVRKIGNWICHSCGHSSLDAHMPSLKDYTLLKKHTITNKELRLFLGIESETIAQRILAAMDLNFTGLTKNREYMLPGKI